MPVPVRGVRDEGPRRRGADAGPARGHAALAARADPHRRAGDAPPRARPEPADRGRGVIVVRPSRTSRCRRTPTRPASGWSCCRSRSRRSGTSSTSSAPKASTWPIRTRWRPSRRRSRSPSRSEDEIGPRLQDFATIGELYRAIELGLDRLAERLGEARLFLGPPEAQAVVGHFPFSSLVAVTDLASAHQAIDTIVEQGEGARGRVARGAFRAARRDPRRVPRPSGRGPVVRAVAAGARCRGSPAGGRPAGPAHHRPVHEPLRGPPERGLRGHPPAAGAVLRPHGRDRRPPPRAREGERRAHASRS